MPRAKAIAMLLAAAGGVAAAVLIDRYAPPPLASVAEGSEECFATGGLDEREIPPGQGPIRWMGARASFAFGDLPPGSAAVEVRVRGNASPVAVAIDDQIQGEIAPAGPKARFELPEGPRGGRVEVVLQTQPSPRGSRQLGALIGYVRVLPSKGWRLPPGLSLRLAATGALAAVAALVAGLAPAGAVAAGLLAVIVTGLGLWPHGLQHSLYAARLPWFVAGASAAAALLARWLGAGAAGFAALAAAFVFHGIAATSPLMVVSDAVFHAHVLRDVAGGDWFPTSVTQHARPFRIPYGAAFYALLVPAYRAGLDPVAVVRWGAGLSGCFASVALLRLLLPLGAARAAMAVALWIALPGTFAVYSAGNLSNAFGQWVTVGFLAWWASGAPPGMAAGALLVALAGASHLSSFIVLIAVTAALLATRRRELDRRRLWVLGVGLGLAALYYSRYAGLVLEQLPRLFEGAGQGRGGVTGLGGTLLSQVLTVLETCGLPVLVLAAAARWRGPTTPLERDVRAYTLGAFALFLVALVSPLEVRYVLALGPGLALLAAEGTERLARASLPGRFAAALLLLAQAALAVRYVGESVLARYR